jgi:hypothetical protein
VEEKKYIPYVFFFFAHEKRGSKGGKRGVFRAKSGQKKKRGMRISTEFRRENEKKTVISG